MQMWNHSKGRTQLHHETGGFQWETSSWTVFDWKYRGSQQDNHDLEETFVWKALTIWGIMRSSSESGQCKYRVNTNRRGLESCVMPTIGEFDCTQMFMGIWPYQPYPLEPNESRCCWCSSLGLKIILLVLRVRDLY